MKVAVIDVLPAANTVKVAPVTVLAIEATAGVALLYVHAPAVVEVGLAIVAEEVEP